MEVVIATRNPDKAREVKALLRESGIEGIALNDIDPQGRIPEIDETGSSLRENAFIKARTIFSVTGKPVIGDDTGLEVDVLNGAPGLHSARYAGKRSTYQDNVTKLLSEMEGVPEDRRTARFRTVACFVAESKGEPGVRELWTEGVVEGLIRSEPEGNGGFGYDPVFYIPGLGKTYAELSEEEKNRWSHRGKAMRKLVVLISKDVSPTNSFSYLN